MSRVLLSGFRLRIGDSNFDNPPNTSPYRLAFFDSSTSLPKVVYAGPDIGDTSLGSIVALDSEGYVPVSGIWLDIGRYNIELQSRINVDPINGDTWQTLWTINKVAGGVEENVASDTDVRFVKTINDIRALEGTSLGGLTFNLGYYDLNDGGQGEWRWVSDSIEVDDGGAYLKPTTYSTSLPGRWHRVMPSGGEVDVRMWGAVSSQVDVSGNIELAQQWCSRTSNDTGITLAFPTGIYNISTASITLQATGLTEGATNKIVKYHVYQNAFFVGATGVASVTFASPTIIDSTAPIVGLGINLYFSQGSVDKVDERWWSSTNQASRLNSADQHGLPVFVDELISLTAVKTMTNKVIIGANGSIATSATINYKGGVEVHGSPRVVFGILTGGMHTIYQDEIEAWWFGWGTVAGNDQSVALHVAMYCASSSNATLVVGSLPTPMGIYSSCGDASFDVQVRITGRINIYDGANLYLGNVLADRKHIFNILGTGGAPVTIENGVIYPEWFGAKYGANSDTAFHYMMQSRYRGVAKGSMVWVDGGGNQYVLTETIYMVAGSIGLKDMVITISTQTANIGAIYIGDGTNITYNYALKNVTIGHTAVGDRRPTILFDHASNCDIDNCNLYVDHGIVFSTQNSSNIRIRNNSIAISNGAMLYTNTTLVGVGSTIAFHDNIVNGLNNTVYGTTPTRQMLPAAFASIYNNQFIGSATTEPIIIDYCRDSTLEVSDTGNNIIRNNTFINTSLRIRTKYITRVEDNIFVGTETALKGKIIIASVNAGEVTSFFYVKDNTTVVEGDWTNGYLSTNPPSNFGTVCVGNAPSSICTHKTHISQATIAADDNGRITVNRLFPYAPILSFQMSMLASGATNNQDTYNYAPVASSQIHQNEFAYADSTGKFVIDTTNASYSGEGRDWVQWSINIGCSYYYMDR